MLDVCCALETLEMATAPLLEPSSAPRPEHELARIMARAYEDVTDEVDCTLEPTRGALPAALSGVYFRNGPGAMGVGSDRYDHPFDGDGMIARFALRDGRLHYRNRFVRTREFVAERDAGRMLYRGFGTQLPGGPTANVFRLSFKNAANTGVVWHAGRLLALWEGGLPHLVDPDTLETLERFDFGGELLNRRSLIDRKLNPELPFSAHPYLDERTGELLNFGVAHGVSPRLMLYTLDAKGRMTEREHVDIDSVFFTHDFTATPSWRVFFLPPVSFDLGRALAGVSSPSSSLHVVPDAPTTIMLVHRKDASRRVTLPCPPGFIFHFVNAWEEGDDRLVVDGLALPELPPHDFWTSLIQGVPPADYPRPQLTRYTLNLTRGTVDRRVLSPHPLEFPTPDTSGIAHARAWFVGVPAEREVPYMSALARWDQSREEMLLRDLHPDLPGEPVYVEDPEGGPGWLVVAVYRADAHRSELVVYGADDLEERCAFTLHHHLPPGFHGSFVPGG